MSMDWTGFNRKGLKTVWKQVKLFIKVSAILGVCGIALGCFLAWMDDSSYSVLTEAGQVREAEYQEWKQREDDSRLQQRKQERFLRRYEREK